MKADADLRSPQGEHRHSCQSSSRLRADRGGMGNRMTNNKQLSGLILSALLAMTTAARAGAPDIDYILETCYSCHRSGADGAIPALTGRPGIMNIRALNEYRTGARKNVIMTPIAMDLDPNIIGMLAAFLAKAR